MPADEPFQQEYSTALDSFGNGSVSFGPNRLGTSWTSPMTIAVNTSTSAAVPIARVTMGSTKLGSTYTGSDDSDDLPNVLVHVGQKITVTWSGGDPGAVATASLTCTLHRW